MLRRRAMPIERCRRRGVGNSAPEQECRAGSRERNLLGLYRVTARIGWLSPYSMNLTIS